MGLVATVAGGAYLVFAKFKFVLIALKLTKLAPVASMLLSSFAYSMIFGPIYGCGMVALILVHECGHAIAMRYYGLPFSPMVFIPFMGAVIAQQGESRSAWEDAVISLAGPAIGGLGAAGLALGAGDSQLLIALADWGYMINLFNLLPIGMLDGGRVADTLSPWLPAAGLVAGTYVAVTGIVSNPIFYLILLSGAYTTGSRFWGSRVPPPHYRPLSQAQQGGVFAAYAGLTVALVLAMRENNKRKLTPSQLAGSAPHGAMFAASSSPDLGALRGAPVSASDDEKYDDIFGGFFGGDQPGDDHWRSW